MSSAIIKLSKLPLNSLVDSSNEEFAVMIMLGKGLIKNSRVTRTSKEQRALLLVFLLIFASCTLHPLHKKERVMQFINLCFITNVLSGVVQDPLEVYTNKGTALHLTFHNVPQSEELILF